MSEIVERLRIDADGRLVAGDPTILALNARAGGSLGSGIALPQVALLARLAQRLNVPVTRTALVADGNSDIELWVEATPDAIGAAIELSGWHRRPAAPAVAPDLAENASHAGSFAWACDPTLRMTEIGTGAAVLGVSPATLVDMPITRLFALDCDAEGDLPLLMARAAVTDFEGQPAFIRGSGLPVMLRATLERGDDGRLLGFRGVAEGIGKAPAVPTAEAFSAKLDKALRGPLVRIAAGADSIAAQADGPIRRDYALYADDIGNAARHLMALVDDLVDLEAIERPDFRVTPETIELGDLARRAAGLLSVRASDRQVRIDRPDAAERVPARGDFRRVLQILVNLLSNAVRYSPAGGMVWVRIEEDGGHAQLTVADQGKGIAAADHNRIFDRFARVDPGEAGGSGLGLYISRTLARAMGGDITVDSAPGQGARFNLTLPTG